MDAFIRILEFLLWADLIAFIIVFKIYLWVERNDLDEFEFSKNTLKEVFGIKFGRKKHHL